MARVAQVFISYSTQHRGLTEALATSLEAAEITRQDGRRERLTVWWDKRLVAGDVFPREITAALDAADAVVVIWSEGAVASDWVYAEVVRAAAKKTLVPTRSPDLDFDTIPLPFNIYQTCAVDDVAAVLAGIERRIAGAPPEPRPGHVAAELGDVLLDTKQDELEQSAAVKSPAALLLARYRLVAFEDLHGFRDDF
ncbi:toll/interleukin-1 receptor domain-containing protein, partial [Rhodoplanes sp. SY1]|uniref:toll/interleukin-1 receptor domain-containing protein n=1 Tax=Rhodoplanes sp. SY1 TaxID=3166646 RepID=UPI0038B4A579